MKSILYELRVQHGLTQSQLSKKLGVSQPEVARLERGKRRIRFDLLQRMAVIFKMSVDEITKMQVDITPPEPNKIPDGIPLIGYVDKEFKINLTDIKPHNYIDLGSKFNDHYCVKVSGNNLVPRYKPNEIVVCENNSSYNTNDDILVQIKDEEQIIGLFGVYIGQDDKNIIMGLYTTDSANKTSHSKKLNKNDVIKISKIVGCFSI